MSIDNDADAAYLKVSDDPIARTEEYSPDVLVDLDQYGLVVGIEFLTLDMELNLDEFSKKHHIKSDVASLIRESTQNRWSHFSTSMATGVASTATWLEPA
ncbi:DUF2283 domain-containing protein [Mycobacteroides abscessus]|uniref:DUF2283 domain-containing protein n=1 Tax=Mycobacteroides abscessus TaxID=36809 RepID=UPI0013FCF9E2|nr:DUF2283 domain-containing protein [Mycobacteroides abscessus]